MNRRFSSRGEEFVQAIPPPYPLVTRPLASVKPTMAVESPQSTQLMSLSMYCPSINTQLSSPVSLVSVTPGFIWIPVS